MNQQNKAQPGDQPDNENVADGLISYTGGYVALPFDQEQFRDFVVSLLGKPQTIEKRIYGRFEVNLQDIQNFHYLIDQRLAQQNNALLAQFRAKVYFSGAPLFIEFLKKAVSHKTVIQSLVWRCKLKSEPNPLILLVLELGIP